MRLPAPVPTAQQATKHWAGSWGPHSQLGADPAEDGPPGGYLSRVGAPVTSPVVAASREGGTTPSRPAPTVTLVTWWKASNTRHDLYQRIAGFLLFAAAAVLALVFDASPGLTWALMGSATGWACGVAYRWQRLHAARRSAEDRPVP